MKLKIFPSLIAAVVLLLSGSVIAQESQPSLTDVAKQKSSTVKAKKVITDDDMPSTSVPAPAAPATSAATAASSTASTGESKSAADAPAKSSSASNTKAAVTGKLAELQKELDDVNHDEALLNKKLDELQQKIDKS